VTQTPPAQNDTRQATTPQTQAATQTQPQSVAQAQPAQSGARQTAQSETQTIPEPAAQTRPAGTVIRDEFAAPETAPRAASGDTEHGGTPQTPAREDEVADLYAQALQAYNAKNYPEALALVNGFLTRANTDIDKGLYLKGQILESESPSQNIKEARATYTRLVSEFPTSALWQDARNRITFLNRFYFEIR
jgi:TolA-binding protein